MAHKATHLRDSLAGPAARTTIVLGLVAAALAFAVPVVTTLETSSNVPAIGSPQR